MINVLNKILALTLSGWYETELLKQMSREFGHLTVVAVEPTDKAKDMNQALTTTKELKDVQFSWAKEKLDDFRSGPRGGQKHHVISIIHTLYYMSDLEDSLNYLLSAVEEGGILIVCLVSGKSLFIFYLLVYTF